MPVLLLTIFPRSTQRSCVYIYTSIAHSRLLTEWLWAWWKCILILSPTSAKKPHWGRRQRIHLLFSTRNAPVPCEASSEWMREAYLSGGVIGTARLLMYTSLFSCLQKCSRSLLTEVKACHRREKNGLWCSWIAVLLASQHGIGWLSWGKISTPETLSQSCIRLEWKVVWSGCVKTYPAFFFSSLKRLEFSLRKKNSWKLLQASLAIAFDFHDFRAKCGCFFASSSWWINFKLRNSGKNPPASLLALLRISLAHLPDVGAQDGHTGWTVPQGTEAEMGTTGITHFNP